MRSLYQSPKIVMADKNIHYFSFMLLIAFILYTSGI